MSYKQSSYEPNHWEPQGPPVRPFNWVQWAGVGLLVFGLIGMLAEFAARVGWISFLDGDFVPFVSFMPLGAVLMNSRRQPISPEQCARQRRRALIVAAVALVACILSAAITILIFKGA